MLRGKRTEQFLLNRALGDKDENLNGLSLAHPVGSRHVLFKHGRVPRQIDVDHGICGLKVQASRSGVCGKEQAAVGVSLKVVDQTLPQFLRNRSIETDETEVAFLE